MTKLKRASKAEIMPLSGAAGIGIDAVLDRLSDAIPASIAVPQNADTETDWSPL